MPDIPPPVLDVPELPAPAEPRRIGGMDDAARELLRVEAFTDALDSYKTRLRGYVASRLPRGGKYPVPGVAPTVSMSDPQAKPTVVDADAFAEAYASVFPDEVETRHRVDVLDHEAAAAASDYAELRAALRIREEIVLPEKAVDRLVAQCAYDNDRGCYVHHETGLAVDGLTLRPPGDPRLTIRFDKTALETLSAALRERTNRALPNPDNSEELPA